MMPAVFWLGEFAWLSLAAASDLRRRIVPNSLVLLLAANGMLLRLVDHAGPRQLAASVITGSFVLVALGQLARHGFIGGGDAKLFAAVTLMVPASQVPPLLLAIMLVGGASSCLYLALRRAAASDPVLMTGPVAGALAGSLRLERRRAACGVPMPYAPAVLLGCVGFAISEMLP